MIGDNLELSELSEMDVCEAAEWQDDEDGRRHQYGTDRGARCLSGRFRRRRPVVPLVVFTIGAAVLLVVWATSASQNRKERPDSSSLGGDEKVTGGVSTIDPSSPTGTGSPEAAVQSSNLLNCTHIFTCQTDRMGYFQWMHRGQALCNDVHRFGLTLDGALIKEVCGGDFGSGEGNGDSDGTSAQTFVLLHQDPSAEAFQMTDHGHFQLVSSTLEGGESSVLWEAIPTIQIEPTPVCLSQPKLDCPYLHLHKSGDLVLNSIQSDGSWSDRKARKVFPDLFQKDP